MIAWEGAALLGAQAVRRDDDGLTVSRLSDRARRQVTDPAHLLVADMAAGVRLSLQTSSATLELDVQLTLLQPAGLPPSPAAFDLVVDGRLRQTVHVDTGRVVEVDLRTRRFALHSGGPTTVRFDGLPADPSARVEVWLPHGTVVALRALRVEDGAQVRPVPAGGPSWVHYGSSISHCLEAPSPTRTWPGIVSLAAGLELANLSVAGQCLLEQHVARTVRDLPAELITAEVGVNVVNADAMRERAFVPALHGFLDTVRDGHPTTPVILVSPVLFPAAEEHPGPSLLTEGGTTAVVPRPPELAAGALSVRRVRELVAEVVAGRRQDGDAHLHLVDGLTLLGPDDADELHDGLHPGPHGYELVAGRFSQQLAQLLGWAAPT